MCKRINSSFCCEMMNMQNNCLVEMKYVVCCVKSNNKSTNIDDRRQKISHMLEEMNDFSAFFTHPTHHHQSHKIMSALISCFKKCRRVCQSFSLTCLLFSFVIYQEKHNRMNILFFFLWDASENSPLTLYTINLCFGHSKIKGFF